MRSTGPIRRMPLPAAESLWRADLPADGVPTWRNFRGRGLPREDGINELSLVAASVTVAAEDQPLFDDGCGANYELGDKAVFWICAPSELQTESMRRKIL